MTAAHDVRARPLRPGASISNPSLPGMGTIGFFATRAGACVLVTARHVAHGAGYGKDVLKQPGGGDIVADVVRVPTPLDVACAKIRDFPARNDAIGIGPICIGPIGIGPTGAPRAPTVGMRVLKSGYVTGVTEGTIKSIDGNEIVVVPRKGLGRYRLTEPGDSGAVWVTIDTHEAIAMHVRGNTSGAEYSEAIRIDAILTALTLVWA